MTVKVSLADVYAARLKIVLNEHLGKATPDWIVRLAHAPGAPEWLRPPRRPWWNFWSKEKDQRIVETNMLREIAAALKEPTP